MDAIGLFRGPAHIMERANEALDEIAGRDGRGVPVREAFPEPKYRGVQLAMDCCFRSGQETDVEVMGGRLYVFPRRRADGSVMGVRTVFVAVPLPRSPLPPAAPDHVQDQELAGAGR